MNGNLQGSGRWPWLRAALSGALLSAVAACGASDGVSPSAGPTTSGPAAGDSIAAPVDSAAIPADSTLIPVDTSAGLPDSSAGLPSDSIPAVEPSTLASGMQPGIVFGSWGMYPEELNSIHTGTLRGGGITENNVISFLTAVRAKGGRLVLKMSMGRDSYVKTNGVFDLAKWKALVARFKNVNLGPFISDGTLMGHFLIDEPHRSAKWGKVVSQATVESMAAYSKSIWPGMTTFVRVSPIWLASAPVTYRALDAGWLQYGSGKGEVGQLAAAEVSAAKSKGLGIVMGLNILDGGNGSSKVAGWTPGKYAMSATEIRTYGTAMLNLTYTCGFFNWMYEDFGAAYYARTDIKSALVDLSNKAKAHVRTSCRQ
jgi:hypothetical protein